MSYLDPLIKESGDLITKITKAQASQCKTTKLKFKNKKQFRKAKKRKTKVLRKCNSKKKEISYC